MGEDTTKRILDKLDRIEENQTLALVQLAAIDVKTTHQELRVTSLEKKAWHAVGAVVVSLAAILMAGAKSIVTFWVGR